MKQTAMSKLITATLVLISLCVSGFAQDPVRAKLYTKTVGETVHAVVELRVDLGWHIYDPDLGNPEAIGKPTLIELSGGGLSFGELVFPEPERHEQVGLGTWINTHHGKVLARSSAPLVEGADPLAVRAAIDGLVCKDEVGGICVPFNHEATARAGKAEYFAEAELASSGSNQALDVGEAEEASVEVGSAATQQNEDGEAEDEAPLGTFLFEAFFWGLITLLMPCTYPMIPITISFFTKQALARDGKVLSLSLAYGAGIVLVFVAIGVVVGAPIQEFANHPVFNLFIAAMFVFFAFTLFGWFNLQPPAFLMQAAGKASATGGLVGVFLMGLTLVVTSFTCTAPFVGTLLARGGDQGIARVVMGMGVFGLTMATPFVFLSLFPSRAQKMPGAGAWMNTLKVFLGFIELAAALKFLSTADLAWEWGFLSKEVFLILWAGIFAVAAMYLFGKINLKGEESGKISPGRMVGGTVTFMFALYCAFLTMGFRMDPLLTAFAPPYSSALGQTGEVGHDEEPWSMVVDDWEGALASARSEEKLLLVNFTGFN
jgi:thiol:disulfide interchange protein